jgi:hypothetical protein
MIIGITVGIAGGIVTAILLHTRQDEDAAADNLRDAKAIIASCEAKIHEIESGLEAVRTTQRRAVRA